MRGVGRAQAQKGETQCMPNPVQNQPNDKALAEVSAHFEEDELPYHRYMAQRALSGENCPASDISVIAQRMTSATSAAEAIFNNPDEEPKFEPDDVTSARVAIECLERLFASVP